MTQPPAPKPNIVFIVGCTASGKGQLAHHLALKTGAEIISVDSMKVYRHMDIGTAKPPASRRRKINYHLIDVVEPSEPFSAARFVELAHSAIAEIHSRNTLIIASGGTALYLKALTEGLFDAPPSQPEIRRELNDLATTHSPDFLHRQLRQIDPPTAQRLHPNDIKRIIRALEVFRITGKPISQLQQQFGTLRDDYNMLFVGVARDRDVLNHRINTRVKKMVQAGLVDEVRNLLTGQPPPAEQARQALGYAEVIDHLEGRCDLASAIEKIKINSRRFAKSQRTWFRRMPHIQWFDIPEDAQPTDLIAPIIDKIRTTLPTAQL